MIIAVGVLLLAAAVISVWVLSARADARCQLPEEPWLGDWTPPDELTLQSQQSRIRRIHDVRNGWEPNPEALRALKGDDA